MSRLVLLLCGCMLALGGCASTWVVDTQVQAFSNLPALPAQPSYRFERLPSQQLDGQQDLVESLADPALFKAGLRRDDAAPRYSVQVAVRVQRVLSPWADPWDDWGGSFSAGFGRPGGSFGFGWGGGLLRSEQPWYVREASVVVRELAGNRVVFESRANGDGPWSDSRAVLAAMFDAALQGFPNPPAGARRVSVQVGASTAPAVNTIVTATSPAPASAASAPKPAQ